MTAATAPDVTLVDTQAPAKRRRDGAFRLAMYACIAFAIVTLGALLVFVLTEGWDRLGWSAVTNQPSARPARAGFQSALAGSILVVGLTALASLPLGVGTAVYLEEFAHHGRWYNRLIDLTIQNLAGVPSIVFGVLALGFIAREGVFGIGLGWGFTVGSAALTLTLVVLPTVIIASREAIRAVPPSLRQGALALGATQWQAVQKQVLPAAVPGIATGSILAVSRALGESAPLLLIGGVTFLTKNPDGLDSPFTVMPLMIYNYIADSRAGFRTLAAAGIVVLLVVLLAMNSAAILIRNRFQKKW
jgi:phosphate transport system permease protein